MYRSILNPLGNRVLALVLFIITLPVSVLVVIVLALANRGKVFFVQQRLGYHHKPFYLLKFKTMLDSRDAKGMLLPDVERQFALGNFLRHFHLDELPQLWNVLKGELNLIGPRPLLVEYLPYYTDIEKTRHSCKPGITGLVQALGGNQLTWKQRLRLDVFYVRHQSFGLDWLVFWRTVRYFFSKPAKGREEHLFSESFIDYLSRSQK